jgi:RNA polymerase-binding transcription factor DksA
MMRHDPIDPGALAVLEHPCDAAPPGPPPRAIGARLDALERRVRTTVRGSAVELDTLASPEPGESENDATRLLAVGVLSDVIRREWKALEEIAAARTRLTAGTYGRCAACSREVGGARLLAVPTARYCVACQASTERPVPVA